MKAGTDKDLRAVLKEFNVYHIGSLVKLDIDELFLKLKSKGINDQVATALVQEVNKVRSSFWNMRTKHVQQGLWLLVREQYLCIDDLRLFYNVLDGRIVVPAYLLAALQDGVELMTKGIDRDCPVRLERVSFSFEAINREGRVQEVFCYRHFFTDAVRDATDSQAVVSDKISAETAAELLVAIRREITSTVGWSPQEETTKHRPRVAM